MLTDCFLQVLKSFTSDCRDGKIQVHFKLLKALKTSTVSNEYNQKWTHIKIKASIKIKLINQSIFKGILALQHCNVHQEKIIFILRFAKKLNDYIINDVLILHL